MSKPDRYAVVGHPISHSRSPEIHRMFAEQCAQSLTYEAIDVVAGDFTAFVRRFFADGGGGLNVTLPHKATACEIAATLSERARLAGAANTLWQDAAGRICADNTDGAGLVRDLTVNLGLKLAGCRLLLLGAGGAARGVVAPLLELRPRQLVIGNRTVSRAEELAARFAGLANAVGAQCLVQDDATSGMFDLIVNATAASLSGELPGIPTGAVGAGSVCYDMAYGKQSVFLQWAREQGAARAVPGLGMLAEQAAEAFWIWRGVRPQTAPVMQMLAGAARP
jgi:shikimate dehydrogenase